MNSNFWLSLVPLVSVAIECSKSIPSDLSCDMFWRMFYCLLCLWSSRVWQRRIILALLLRPSTILIHFFQFFYSFSFLCYMVLWRTYFPSSLTFRLDHVMQWSIAFWQLFLSGFAVSAERIMSFLFLIWGIILTRKSSGRKRSEAEPH